MFKGQIFGKVPTAHFIFINCAQWNTESNWDKDIFMMTIFVALVF
jgi:hypothetical protein